MDIHVFVVKNRYVIDQYKEGIMPLFREELKIRAERKINQVHQLIGDVMQSIRKTRPKDQRYELSRAITEKIDNSRAIIQLETCGCTHARRTGGCSICGLQLNNLISYQETFDYFLKDFKQFDYKKYPTICVYTNGSFLDDSEIPRNIREDILKTISAETYIKKVILETRPEFVTQEKINQLKILGDQELILTVGLDIKDDELRSIMYKKYSLEDYDHAVRLLKKNNITFCTFVSVKAPFLTEQEGINVAKETIQYAIDSGVSEMFLEPLAIQEYTLQHYLAKNNAYSVLYLWSMIELVRYAHEYCKDYGKQVQIKIGGELFAPLPIEFAHNCEKCNDRIKQLIRKYNYTYDVGVFDEIPSLEEVKKIVEESKSSSEPEGLFCECQIDWLNRLNETPEIPLNRISERISAVLEKCKSNNHN